MATPIYIISITNPTSENEKNYRQEITFIKQGPRASATTTFPASAPNGLAGITLTNEWASISAVGYEALAKEMIITIRRTFDGKNIDRTFAITEVISPPAPAPLSGSIGGKIPTPLDVENARKKEAEQIKSDNTKILDVNLPAIENSTPGSLKPQGNARLSGTITALGKKIIVGLIPIAIDIVIQFITQIIENEITKAKEKATTEQQKIQDQINTLDAKRKSGTKGLDAQIGALTAKKEAIPAVTQAIEDNLRSQLTNLGSFTFNELPNQIPPILKTVFASGCPNPNSPTIKKIITIRNGLVTSLNAIGKQLDTLTKATTGLNTFLGVSQTVIDTLKITKVSTSLAVKAVPTPPGVPGIITSTLSDLEDIINKSLFEKDGTPRLPKIAGSIASASLAISMINIYIQQIVGILSALDFKLKQCAPDLTSNSSFPGLVPISDSLISISIIQTKTEQTQNGITYAGFLIEIEEVPYTPTVNRRRAVGKNQSGITLIQTELSFTTQDEILINELKLIIDRDNLKAY
jgi:hypothetical protein